MAKTPKVCDLCGGSESEGRPMLSVGGANICFQCVEGLAYHMFKSDMGDIAADRILALVRGTHPELLPEEPQPVRIKDKASAALAAARIVLRFISQIPLFCSDFRSHFSQ